MLRKTISIEMMTIEKLLTVFNRIKTDKPDHSSMVLDLGSGGSVARVSYMAGKIAGPETVVDFYRLPTASVIEVVIRELNEVTGQATTANIIQLPYGFSEAVLEDLLIEAFDL